MKRLAFTDFPMLLTLAVLLLAAGTADLLLPGPHCPFPRGAGAEVAAPSAAGMCASTHAVDTRLREP